MSDRKKLEKITIRSFEDREFKKEDPEKKFLVPINPESFTQNFKINVETRREQGRPGSEVRYKSTTPEELRLDFVLDGTKTMESYGGEDSTFINMPVKEQLDKFLKCVYHMDDKTHRPQFLIISWGEEIKFGCVLSNIDINYTLFESNGKPLRAKITATFLRHQSGEEQLAKSRISSPDLTHYRKVEQSDRLDLMVHEIYGDSNYFLQVAKANGLTSVRNVQPGLDLYFPPFDKNEA